MLDRSSRKTPIKAVAWLCTLVEGTKIHQPVLGRLKMVQKHAAWLHFRSAYVTAHVPVPILPDSKIESVAANLLGTHAGLVAVAGVAGVVEAVVVVDHVSTGRRSRI